jgi:phage shock protein A
MIKLMIREMEDTLVELKASCAGVMADGKKLKRRLDEVVSRGNYWKEKAELAVSKRRDDLAREALLERRRLKERSAALELEFGENKTLIEQYQEDIQQLEEKLRSAIDKRRMLIQRHVRAVGKKRAQEEIRRIDSAEAIFKFEEMENRIDRMEAEAGMVNYARKTNLEEEVDALGVDDEIEQELRSMKSNLKRDARNGLEE